MKMNRRTLFQTTAAALAAGAISQMPGAALAAPLSRAIPSTGQTIPLVGLGSWITFNVGSNPKLLDQSAGVIAAFLENGGRLIDSSPMYGSSQATIGYALEKLGASQQVFSADKVWTSSSADGKPQIEASRSFWGVPKFDLMQVHNLVAWEDHLETLQAMKASGDLTYIGITTSHGRRHGDLEKILTTQPVDFVQLTYNIANRDVEQRLLPLARERGIAVIVNRPFMRGDLVKQYEGKPLPGWAADAMITSWAQYLLKFVISHPAVTCAIPATTRVEHVVENLGCASGQMPDAAMRKQMAEYAEQV